MVVSAGIYASVDMNCISEVFGGIATSVGGVSRCLVKELMTSCMAVVVGKMGETRISEFLPLLNRSSCIVLND